MFYPRRYTNRRYLDALRERVLIFDGAMGTNLAKLGLTAAHFGGEAYEGFNDILPLTYPQAVETVHRSFLEVGVDVIETDTFRSNRITAAEFGLQDRVLELNRAAAALARRLADEYAARDGRPRFVAGSIGPTGKLPSADDPDLSDVTFAELADVFREQAVGLLQGGVDVLLLETHQDILEVKAAIHGLHRAMHETGIFVPIQAQVTLDTTGRMLLGTDIEAVVTILAGMPIDLLGLNCSTGPEHMREPVRFLSRHSPLPISVLPNAGLPLNVDGEAVYPLEPEPFADAMQEFVEVFGVSVVGGCCGTTPEHLRLLVERLRGRPAPRRKARWVPRLASGIRAYAMRQDPPPFLIGERCNAQGSRKFKRLLLAEDWDGIVTVAQHQVDGGAHALDVSVAVTERDDEAHLMRTVVRKLVTTGIPVPLVFDTTDPAVMEAALQVYPGRALLNSTHLEAGPDKARRVFRLAKAYNAAVMVLTIDEQGMARTAAHKVAVARRLYDLALDEGLRPEDLVVDPLTFTLATGDPETADAARHTLEALRGIKAELPGVFTSLGVSNVSFGLGKWARAVLNSVFLYHAVQAGLDMAIVNPVHILAYADIPPEQRALAEDLIFHRRADALARFVAYFERQQAAGQHWQAGGPRDPLEGLATPERVHRRIVQRLKDGLEADLDALLAERLDLPGPAALPDHPTPQTHDAAVWALNQVLLPAMKEVGDKFGAGELILPFVLQSAEVMKRAVAHLERFLVREEGAHKGTLVLATVYGDVHDIGKNLVKTILSNNGYRVVDLGKQVPVETILQAAVEHRADAIGLSALLVSTSQQMPKVVNELHRRGLRFPVLVGGAAINRRFGRRINITEDGQPYEPGVFYCKDAFEGLQVMDQLMDPAARPRLLAELRAQVEAEQRRATQEARKRVEVCEDCGSVPPAPNIPRPREWGVRVVRDIPLEAVFPLVDKRELFRLSWGAKNARGPEWERLQAEFEARFADLTRAARRHGWLRPQAVYGYFPAQREGNRLLVYDPASVEQGHPRVLEVFTFPRQVGGEGLCLADYFASVHDRVMDVVAFQVVTVGPQAEAHFQELEAAGHYSEAYFFHGLAVQTAEATAEYIHRHIRRELGLPPGRGKRYSWGYPAIPDLRDHEKVFRLLPARQALGMSLTPAYQLVPEHSTAAIVVHHPLAKYFHVGKSRLQMLTEAGPPQASAASNAS